MVNSWVDGTWDSQLINNVLKIKHCGRSDLYTTQSIDQDPRPQQWSFSELACKLCPVPCEEDTRYAGWTIESTVILH